MSTYKQLDIEIEIKELCQELQAEIMQQLNYYNASVYKNETAEIIKEKVKKLKLTVDIFADENLIEPFNDYEAEISNGNINYFIGECSFSARVSRLMASLTRQFEVFSQQRKVERKEFTNRVKKRKKEILSLCSYGSRQWSFFQKI